MGARHSKRSVDITTTPKKGEDGAVIADGDDAKLEKIAEPDLKVTTNGGLHSEIEFADKEEETSKADDEDKEKASDVQKNGFPEEPILSEPEPKTPADEETVATPKTEEKIEEVAEPKKKKDKKKKWSFRSISFSRKDKSKPAKEGSTEKNGDVQEVAEESAESDKSPSADNVPAVEDVAPVLTNGDSVAPDQTPAKVDTPEPAKTEEPPTKAEPTTVEDTKVEEPVKVEDIKPVESLPVEEEPVKAEEKCQEPLEVVERLEEASIEVRTEEVPPPLPASNPPSPVTVFAESTKAEAALTSGQVPLEEALPEEPASEGVVAQIPLPVDEVAQPDPSPSMEDLPPAPPSPVPVEPLVAEVEPPAEPAAAVEEAAKEEEPTTPPPTPSASLEMTLPAPAPESSSPVLEEAEEPVAPADSLQDISTESLPSLPEPVSESLAPLSLPPVDFVPAPIAGSPSPPVAAEELDATPLTNGNVNGHSSPSPIEEPAPPGPPKQIMAEAVKECEISHEAGDKPAESTMAKAAEE